MEEVRDAVEKDLNHERKLGQYGGPSLIMHTFFDGLLDATHARRLHEWAQEPKRLRIFEEGDHNSIMLVNFREYFRIVRDFLRDLQGSGEQSE